MGLLDIFTIGEEVEVNEFDGDQDLCFYVGTIIRLYRLTVDVRFRDLKTRNGESLEGAIRMESENELGEEGVFYRGRDVRPSQDWRVKDGVGVWKHKRLLKPDPS
ncbi:hypothetical protein LXL04_011970 [Taraxacum kok-saghyz]